MPIREFGLALMLLTRVPAGWLAGSAPIAPARAVWAFPVVGAAIGAGGALVLGAGRAAGLPGPLAACWALAAMVLLSGALHEDGWADVLDGFGGGGTAERKLAIMRDSRVGSYGALGLALGVAIRVLALASVPAGAVVAIGALGRGSMAVPLLLLPPARADGSGAAMAGVGARGVVCLLLAGAVAALALPPGRAAAGGAAALVAALAITGVARSQIGGFTGDVLGACAVAAECAGLTALACT